MPNQTLRLIFPRQLVDEPVINNLLREYTFTLNILYANISPDSGWIDVRLTGKTAEIDSAITWLENKGVEVILLSQ